MANQKFYYLSEGALKQYYEKQLSKKHEKKRIFVLINRKGYWDYKILFHGKKPGRDSQIVISDRFLDKCTKDELDLLLGGKEVVVYDDSLTNGSNLFYYFLLCKSHRAEKVIPIVYSLNADFPSEKSRRLMIREAERIDKEFRKRESLERLINEFVCNLSYAVMLGNSDIDKMSIWQTQLFQKYLSPLVMDLPIFNHIKGDADNKIIMKREDFEKLTDSSSELWNYFENTMYGWGKPVRASYFQLKNQVIEEGFCSLFHDFVVKCKYERDNDVVKVVFTPFAIVKSISFHDVFHFFKLLYEETGYGKKILEHFAGKEIVEEMKADHGLCRAMFRAIIFRLSDYIGRKFQLYVKQTTGLEIEYDWEMMPENFNKDFVNTQRELYHSFDEEEVLRKIYQFQSTMKVHPIRRKRSHTGDRLRATQERVNSVIRFAIVEKKRNIGAGLYERIYTFETLEDELDERFLFANAEERRIMITKSCLLFLDTNSFSNFLMVSNEEQVIFRGFRYGENSEIFLHENLWFFYAYLYGFYENYVEKSLKAAYEKFMDWLETYLIKMGYIGSWISEDGFQFLRKYFSMFDEKELSEEIRRRRYLLECFDYGEENAERERMIKLARSTVRQWGGV